ncbi:MAG: hypothetical protein WCV85_04190 [Patescibacteria group bacterium]
MALLILGMTHVCQAQQFHPLQKFGVKSFAVQDSIQDAYVREMYTLFQILDAKFVKKVLVKMPDLRHFQERVDAWAADHPERWQEVQQTLAACKGAAQSNYFGTSIDAVEPDVRWALFIINGLPSNVLIVPGTCANGHDTCSIWTYIWRSTATMRQGLEIACQSKAGEHYPTRIIPMDEGFPTAYPMWPFVQVSRFPSPDGSTEAWFTVWVPGNQFTGLTLEAGTLTMRVQLFDSLQANEICADSTTANLQMLRGLLQATQRQDRHLIRAMGCLRLTDIPPGHYHARLTVAGHSLNVGNLWLDILIPVKNHLSDVLILQSSSAMGGNVLPGIVRDSTNLYNNPEAWFTPGTILPLYAEVKLPDTGTFEVRATLLRLPDVSNTTPGSIITGQPYVVADSLNQPYPSGMWQQTMPAVMEQGKDEPTGVKAKTLLREKRTATQMDVTLQLKITLPKKLQTGKYLLSIVVRGTGRQVYYYITRRLIRITKQQ